MPRAGAAPNARSIYGYTPLGRLLEKAGSPLFGECIGTVRSLLRAGASLDLCGRGDEGDVAEKILDIREQELRGFSARLPVNFGELTAVKNLVTGVRAAGSFKLYCRIEHKTILRLRSLVVRKRATTKNALLARIVRLPNGPCWKVLSYWRATE